MAHVRDVALDLERHRQVLEQTVSKLRDSLTHWQQWYLEYASLKEEVASIPSQPPQRKDLARIRRDFSSDLLTKKEVNEIFGKNDLKEADQIVSVLSRRLDYVEQNVDTLRKQIEAAENKLAASTVLANPDGGVDEESGLPITDIIEQIDEEGNVVNWRLQTGGGIGKEVLQALEKAGVDVPDRVEKEKPGEPQHGTIDRSAVSKPAAESTRASDTKEKAVKASNASPKANDGTGKRKSVSFAEDTKAGHDAADAPMSKTAQRLASIMHAAKEQENMTPDSVIIPENESEDDAQLRREILDYSMSEIGPIVAELELDEGATDDDDYEFEDTDDEDEDSEVDELGRSKHSVITVDYIKRMQELEKRLGVQSSFAVQNAVAESEVPVEGLGRIAVRPPPVSEKPSSVEKPNDATEPGKSSKKGVRFAEELDVAGESTSVLPERPAPKKPKKEPEINPLGDVLERTSKPAQRPAEAPAKKPSRFKKDRSAGIPAPVSSVSAPSVPSGPLDAPVRFLEQNRTVAPSGPEGQPLADSILEREVSKEPKDPDELDATLLHQEAAMEYHRVRNRQIQKQGGFVEEEESPITPLDEEEGGAKKMSRFKAARLSHQ